MLQCVCVAPDGSCMTPILIELDDSAEIVYAAEYYAAEPVGCVMDGGV